MSRSRKHAAITGITTADSEAFDKKNWHRALRRAENVRAQANADPEPLSHRQFSDPWNMAKDGKQLLDKSDPFYKKAKRK